MEHTFTNADVLAFGALTGDDQPRHSEPDAEGRLVLQGLLTASLSTRIGGRIGYLAKSATFEFLRPVFTGQRLQCTLDIVGVDAEPGRDRVRGLAIVTNEAGKEVVRCTYEGFILLP